MTGDDSPSVCMQMDIVPLIISVPPFTLPVGMAPMDLAEFPPIQFQNKALGKSIFEQKDKTPKKHQW